MVDHPNPVLLYRSTNLGRVGVLELWLRLNDIVVFELVTRDESGNPAEKEIWVDKPHLDRAIAIVRSVEGRLDRGGPV